MLFARTLVPAVRQLAPVHALLQRRYERRFQTAQGAGCLSGVYGSFAEAAAHAPPGTPVGYQNADPDAAAALYQERLDRLKPIDYPALFWVREALRTSPPARRLFDLGGHVGMLYYASQKYLTGDGAGAADAAPLRWTVCDVPAVVREGEAIARARGAASLDFTTDRRDLDGADVLLASGSLQYIEEPLPDLLASLARPPRHLVINQTPTHAEREFYTLQNIGVAICAYRIAARGGLSAALARLGYETVDYWEDPTRHTPVPYHPEASPVAYSGYYLRRR
jgi:putative methyltransferase (TIGR04325 family)